jgi:uncharacterized protein (TIGR03437 family)
MSCYTGSRLRLDSACELLLLAICTGFPAVAQFSSMETDYAGQRLLFTTRLSQTGAGQPDYGKLFIADWRGVQPLLIYNYVLLSSTGLYPGQPGILTNNYDVDGVDVSSNGAYISVVAAGECSGYTALLCGSADVSTLYDERGQVALAAVGRVRVSPKGKWALAVNTPLYSPDTGFVLHDMTTGVMYSAPVPGATRNRDWRLHDVSDDGTAVIATDAYLYIYRAPASVQSIASLGLGIRSAAINSAGTLIVWEQYSTLNAVKTADLGKTVNLGLGGWADFQPRLTDDGSTILFLSRPTMLPSDPAQAFLMAIDGTGRRPVTAEPEGIVQAVISGNGHVVWALTRTGRLLKIDVDTGARTQYTEPLAAFLLPDNSAVVSQVLGMPGEVISVPASVMPGERVEITVQDHPATVVRVEPQTVVFQIPWTVSTDPSLGSVPIGIRKPDSPSWSGDRAYVLFQALWPTLLASVHQDFSALIGVKQPAQAGEIIHFFGTGFGPVTPPVPDGTPAPIAPLSRTVNAVTCNTLNAAGADSGPAEVLFAGLAPGMIGIYQIDVRLPDPLPAGSFVQIACRVGDRGTDIQVPVRP